MTRSFSRVKYEKLTLAMENLAIIVLGYVGLPLALAFAK